MGLQMSVALVYLPLLSLSPRPSLSFFLSLNSSCHSLHHLVCLSVLSLAAFISSHLLLNHSLPPSFISIRLPSCITNFLIISALVLPLSESRYRSSLLSPAVLTGTILHSVPGLPSCHYIVCVNVSVCMRLLLFTL